LKLWVGLHTLPKTNPLSRISTRVLRRFTSPLQKIAQAHEDIPTDTVETIQEYAISPWEPRISAIINPDSERAAEAANCISGIRIATSSSERRGMVGMGGAIFDTYGRMPNGQPITFAITLGPRSEQNPYVAELEAIAMAIQGVPPYVLRREITIVTSNQAALHVVSQPKQQSGQASVMRIYDVVKELKDTIASSSRGPQHNKSFIWGKKPRRLHEGPRRQADYHRNHSLTPNLQLST
ncbi:hypothetical protein DL95DRAFT_507440, partial [Leptodontidium sp. 2 PMI_412]